MATTYAYNYTELMARGWTVRRIQVFLGREDFRLHRQPKRFRNSLTPANERCWLAERVEQAEQAGALTCALPKPPQDPRTLLEREQDRARVVASEWRQAQGYTGCGGFVVMDGDRVIRWVNELGSLDASARYHFVFGDDGQLWYCTLLGEWCPSTRPPDLPER